MTDTTWITNKPILGNPWGNPIPPGTPPIPPGTITIKEPDGGSASAPDGKPVTFTPCEAKYTLEQVVLPREIREQIDDLVFLASPGIHKLLYEDWELSKIDPEGESTAFLFYGPPGTGKTMCVQAFARALKKQIIDVSYAEIESKYVGETSKNIVAAFRAAADNNAVLFFDEADSILGSRMSNVTQSADQAVNVSRATMLKQLDGFKGIVAFATNFSKNIDSAFVRRIDKHIHIPLPNDEARQAIWKKMVSSKVPGRESLDWDKLVQESEGFAGGDIKNAVVNSLVRIARLEETQRFASTDIFIKEIERGREALRNVGKSPREEPKVTTEIVPLNSGKEEL
ncbi:MAG: ATP-binding protein [Planctomycetaceae bacterium]|jgi:SpoVK/Ycf46/Vps4 family AAA+-type ATPase|nr:ATP-binding protein [Planctomycetaceae bacterium]